MCVCFYCGVILELCASAFRRRQRGIFLFTFGPVPFYISSVLAGNSWFSSAKQPRAEGGADDQRHGHRRPRPPRSVARVHVWTALQAAPYVPAQNIILSVTLCLNGSNFLSSAIGNFIYTHWSTNEWICAGERTEEVKCFTQRHQTRLFCDDFYHRPDLTLKVTDFRSPEHSRVWCLLRLIWPFWWQIRAHFTHP